MPTIYDEVFGGDPYKRAMRGNMLLRMVGLTLGRIGEFRDAWVERTLTGELRIAVYTENGSGPRKDPETGVGYGRINQQTAIELMQSNPCYLGDADDAFQTQYAMFYFSVPPQLPADVLETLERNALPQPVDTDDRWRKALDALSKGFTE